MTPTNRGILEISLGDFNSLTWQEVKVPVQVRKVEGRGFHDFSRFWSHLTKNLLFQIKIGIVHFIIVPAVH